MQFSFEVIDPVTRRLVDVANDEADEGDHTRSVSLLGQLVQRGERRFLLNPGLSYLALEDVERAQAVFEQGYEIGDASCRYELAAYTLEQLERDGS